MKRITVVVITCLLAASCGEKETLPPEVMPINTMKVIVWDISVADQVALSKYPLKKDSLRLEATTLYQQVFATHKTTKAAFYKSYDYYEAHPDLLKVLYDSVSSYGGKIKNAMYKKAFEHKPPHKL